ncbi:lysozyme inhibitor LprI family protein [Marinovum sp.]|uniref:lysozyme inhibitor LprI family protein n=1 Tax=Marinovum sp. TaxID=2024839 RepID=UPI002B26FF23|nr:lysozyme inhibitor LprI family protein [Marinovum sp.]
MRDLLSLAAAAVLTTAGAATADPSYDCSVRLNTAERTICDTALLSDLDRVMAVIFHDKRDQMTPADGRALRKEQDLWLQWRDTCGAATSCLRRRYEQRIIDLAPPGEVPPNFGCAENPYGSIPTAAELPPRD